MKDSQKNSIAILMTCFNRAKLTERCIRTLREATSKMSDYLFDFYVVNDGSTDDTESIINSEFPFVIQLHGTGNMYWNGGMNYAFNEAVKKGYDFYLWVNDDVAFYDNAIEKLMDAYNSVPETACIIAGYTLAEDERTVTYGGQRQKNSIVPVNLTMIQPTDKLEKCDTMHGNCVLIHCTVVDEIGVNDPFYTHGFGDVDYGLMATRNGMPVYLSNFPVGICGKNPNSDRINTYKSKSLIQRFKTFNSWRHNPVKDWKHFTKKFCGRLWFIRFLAPYIKLAINKYE